LRRLRTDGGGSSTPPVSGISFPSEPATPCVSLADRPTTAVAMLRVILLWKMHAALSKLQQQSSTDLGTDPWSDCGSRLVAQLSGRLNVGLSQCMVLARTVQQQDSSEASGPLWTTAASQPRPPDPSHLVSQVRQLAGWNVEVIAWRVWFAWQQLAATAHAVAAAQNRRRLTKACLDAWITAVTGDRSPRRSDAGSGLKCYSIASPPADRSATARSATTADTPPMLLDSSVGDCHKDFGHMTGWRDETFLLAKVATTPSAQHAPQKHTPGRMVVHQAYGPSVQRPQLLAPGGLQQSHEVMMLVQPHGHPPSPRRVADYGG